MIFSLLSISIDLISTSYWIIKKTGYGIYNFYLEMNTQMKK